MKDNLEKFITENRVDFDKAVPNLKIWAAIEKDLASKKKINAPLQLWRTVRRVAAVAALIAFGIFIGLNIQRTNSNLSINSNSTTEQIEDLGVFSPELAEMENFYQSKIKEKKAQLVNYNYDPTLDDDLIELDHFLEELKQALISAPKSKEQQIMEAMIYNYQIRIDMLERVLDRVKTGKAIEKNKLSI